MLDYDVQQDKFILFINDQAFLSLPYQAVIAPPGPQNIEKGIIKLDDVQVHEGYTQYAEDTFGNWCYDSDIYSVTEAYIGAKGADDFKCSSGEALNSLFDDLGRYTDAQEGLKKFTLEWFGDRNTLHEWPLNQLAIKCHHLECLKIYGLRNTTAANRS